MAELFNLVASLTLDTSKYDQDVAAVANKEIPVKDPKLGLDKKDYDEGIEDAGEKAEEFGERSETAFGKVEKALTAAGIVAAVSKISEAFKSAIEYTGKLGDDIGKGAKALQISNRAYQEFDYALKFNNGSANDLRRGIRNLNAVMREGEEATGATADALSTLGISLTDDATGAMKTVEQLISESLIELSKIDDIDKRGALVDALFGPNSDAIKSLLSDGEQGVRDLLGAAERDNMILSDEAIKNAESYSDAVSRFDESVARLKADFAENILPILEKAITMLTDIINFFRGKGMGGGLFAGGSIISGLAAGGLVKWGGKKLLSLFGLGGGGAAAGGGAAGGGGIISRLFGGGGGATGGGGTVIGGGGVLSGIKALGGKLLTAGKAVGGSLFGGAMTPFTVLAASLLPAILAQNETTEKMRKEQAQMEAVADRLEAENSENAKFVRTTAENSYLAKDANGNELKNVLGMSYSQLTDATFESMMGLKDRSGAEKAKLQWMLNGVVNPMTGNYAWTDLNRLWSGELEAGEAQELASAIAAAMSQVGIGDLWSWQRGSGVAQRRELPEGYGYDQWGQIIQLDASGNKAAGTMPISTAYWDDESWDKWLEAHSGEPVEVQPDITDAGIANMQAELDSAELTVTVLPTLEDYGWKDTPSLFGHEKGAWDIPFDNYPALLHRDEMVLTKSRARRYREGEMNADPGLLGEMIGIAVSQAMGRVNVLMSGEKVGDITTRRVRKNINAKTFAKTRAMGG